jgi:hypothetical protein
VPAASLHPEAAWSDKAEFSATLSKLGRMFLTNFGALFSSHLHAKRRLLCLPLLLLSYKQVPSSCTGVPAASLHPEAAWADKAEFAATLSKLGLMFLTNFEHFHDGDAFVGEAMATRIMSGGPVMPTSTAGDAAAPAANGVCNGVANGAAAAAVDLKALKIAAAAEVAAAVQHVGNGSACNGCAAGSAC